MKVHRLVWHQWCRFEKKGQLEVEFPQKSALEKYDFDLTCIEFLTGCQKLDINLENQCWTVGAIFTFGRSRMFGPEKLRPSAVDRSRSRRLKKMYNICHKTFDQQSFKLNW